MWAVAAESTMTADIALYGVLGTLATGMVTTLVYVIRGSKEIEGVGRAVNHVDGPTIQQNVTQIAEHVSELREAQRQFTERGWATGLGEDIDTAPKLTEAIRSLQHETEQIRDKLVEHDAWEKAQKYQA